MIEGADGGKGRMDCRRTRACIQATTHSPMHQDRQVGRRRAGNGRSSSPARGRRARRPASKGLCHRRRLYQHDGDGKKKQRSQRPAEATASHAGHRPLCVDKGCAAQNSSCDVKVVSCGPCRVVSDALDDRSLGASAPFCAQHAKPKPPTHNAGWLSVLIPVPSSYSFSLNARPCTLPSQTQASKRGICWSVGYCCNCSW